MSTQDPAAAFFAFFRAAEVSAPVAARLSSALARKRLASAYLFCGPAGAGKMRAALALAQATLSRDSGGMNAGSLLAGKHPDVLIRRPSEEGSGNLGVERVREEILPFSRGAPFRGNAAFVILDAADRLLPRRHPQSANALLKAIEEPRPGLHFVLCCQNRAEMLPTVRSRAQVLVFPPQETERLCAELQERGASPRTAALAVFLGGADASVAADLASCDALDETLRELSACLDAAASKSIAPVLRLAERIAKSALTLPIVRAWASCCRAALGLPAPVAVAATAANAAPSNTGAANTDGNHDDRLRRLLAALAQQPRQRLLLWWQEAETLLGLLSQTGTNTQLVLESRLLAMQ